MKRICWIAIGGLLISLCAAAQDNTALDQAKVTLSLTLEKMAAEAKVIGPDRIMLSSPVIGAPYSADEVTTFTQTLGDGTRIQREDKVTVYRDGQGRVRRETPKEVTIMDPVAGVAYSIDPAQGTSRKIMVTKTGGSLSGWQATYAPKAVGPQLAATAAAEVEMMKAMVAAEQTVAAVKAGSVVSGSAGSESKVVILARPASSAAEATWKTAAKAQSLGFQSIEGVLSEGTGATETIPAGAVGNDRPIQVINERWYSSELKTMTMTKHSDPRSGEEIFRLTNIRRGEPSPDLFQPPAGCQAIGPCTAK